RGRNTYLYPMEGGCDRATSCETVEGLMELISKHAINAHGENPAEHSRELLSKIKAAFKDERSSEKPNYVESTFFS
ncbi:MAG: DUF1059 domain-containing protein, partial [Candidatus Bathyarchaeia archaeon]